MKITRREICELIADRVAECMSMEELQDYVAEHTYHIYMREASLEEIWEEAEAFGIIDADETLEIIR